MKKKVMILAAQFGNDFDLAKSLESKLENICEILQPVPGMPIHRWNHIAINEADFILVFCTKDSLSGYNISAIKIMLERESLEGGSERIIPITFGYSINECISAPVLSDIRVALNSRVPLVARNSFDAKEIERLTRSIT